LHVTRRKRGSLKVSAGKTDDRSHLERTTEVADNDDNKAQDDEFDRDEINPDLIPTPQY